jgi:4-hydroxybenzoate polyprenyltransferase
MRRRTAVALVRATHFPPTVAVTGFFTALAVAAGLGARTALLAVAVLVGQASIGWANDYLDADVDRVAARPDKPIARGELAPALVGRCAAVALVADVPLSLAVGLRAGAAHLVAVGAAWLYDVRLKYTLASVVPYLVAFALVPVIVAAALPGAPLPRPAVVAAGAACGAAAHFANTLRDVTVDALTGVRGLPQRLGPTRSALVTVAALGVAAGLLVAVTSAAPVALAAAAADLVAGTVLVSSARRSTAVLQRAAFGLLLAAVAVLVVAFVVSGGHRLVSS